MHYIGLVSTQKTKRLFFFNLAMSCQHWLKFLAVTMLWMKIIASGYNVDDYLLSNLEFPVASV